MQSTKIMRIFCVLIRLIFPRSVWTQSSCCRRCCQFFSLDTLTFFFTICCRSFHLIELILNFCDCYRQWLFFLTICTSRLVPLNMRYLSRIHLKKMNALRCAKSYAKFPTCHWHFLAEFIYQHVICGCSLRIQSNQKVQHRSRPRK